VDGYEGAMTRVRVLLTVWWLMLVDAVRWLLLLALGVLDDYVLHCRWYWVCNTYEDLHDASRAKRAQRRGWKRG
jgi:hypothetical protein